MNKFLFLFGIMLVALLFSGSLLVEGMRGGGGRGGGIRSGGLRSTGNIEETYFDDGTEYAFPFVRY
jgi:hypothetical protein